MKEKFDGPPTNLVYGWGWRGRQAGNTFLAHNPTEIVSLAWGTVWPTNWPLNPAWEWSFWHYLIPSRSTPQAQQALYEPQNKSQTQSARTRNWPFSFCNVLLRPLPTMLNIHYHRQAPEGGSKVERFFGKFLDCEFANRLNKPIL